jgi:tetratricopeptide (TPR) repeat protein
MTGSSESNIELWSRLANDMLGHDLYEEAVYYFDKILAVDPVNHRAVDGKANALDILGKVEEALECISNYLECNSSDVYIWILKGDLLDVHYKDYRRAIDCYNRALKVNPQNEEAWVKKAYALKEMGKYADAAMCFKKAMRLFNQTLHLGGPEHYRKCNREYYRELSEEYDGCCNLRSD